MQNQRFRVWLSSSWLLDSFRERAFHLHVDFDHERKVVCDKLRASPGQEAEAFQRCQNYGFRLDILNHYGDSSSARNQWLLKDQVKYYICFSQNRFAE
jgi:hypothetical protein